MINIDLNRISIELVVDSSVVEKDGFWGQLAY